MKVTNRVHKYGGCHNYGEVTNTEDITDIWSSQIFESHKYRGHKYRVHKYGEVTTIESHKYGGHKYEGDCNYGGDHNYIGG